MVLHYLMVAGGMVAVVVLMVKYGMEFKVSVLMCKILVMMVLRKNHVNLILKILFRLLLRGGKLHFVLIHHKRVVILKNSVSLIISIIQIL